jgi:flagellar hook protein FlgE
MMLAQRGYKANVKSLEVQNELQGIILEIVG